MTDNNEILEEPTEPLEDPPEEITTEPLEDNSEEEPADPVESTEDTPEEVVIDPTENTDAQEEPEGVDTPEVLPEIRNAKWNNSEHTSFDVELNHPEYGWIPYTVIDGDMPDTYCYRIWAIKDTLDIQEYEAPVVDLATFKEQKHIELRNQRDQLRKTEFAEFDNDTFQIRQEDQDNMNTFYADAVAMLSGVVDRESFGIMSATNTLHTLTPEQIVQLAKIMKAKVEEIYARYWYARDVLLENATTVAEVEVISIPATLVI